MTANVLRDFPEVNFRGEMSGELCGMGIQIPTQDYKSLCAVVATCTTWVKTDNLQLLTSYVL